MLGIWLVHQGQLTASCVLKPGLIRFFFHPEQCFSLTDSSRFIQIPPELGAKQLRKMLIQESTCMCSYHAKMSVEIPLLSLRSLPEKLIYTHGL